MKLPPAPRPAAAASGSEGQSSTQAPKGPPEPAGAAPPPTPPQGSAGLRGRQAGQAQRARVHGSSPYTAGCRPWPLHHSSPSLLDHTLQYGPPSRPHPPSSLCSASSIAACSTSGDSRLGVRRATSTRTRSAAGPLDPTRCSTSLPAAGQGGAVVVVGFQAAFGQLRATLKTREEKAGDAAAMPGRQAGRHRTRHRVLVRAAVYGQGGQPPEDVVVLGLSQLLEACRQERCTGQGRQ